MVSVPTETQTIKKSHVSLQRTEQCYLCSGSICPSQLAHRRLSKTSLLTRQRRKNTKTENPKVKRAILPSVWFMVRGTRNSDDHPAVVSSWDEVCWPDAGYSKQNSLLQSVLDSVTCFFPSKRALGRVWGAAQERQLTSCQATQRKWVPDDACVRTLLGL